MMYNGSPWVSERAVRFPAFEGKDQTDVVIVGGGITGISAAYLLKREGLKVVLLERGQLAMRDTGHTTAHLTNVIDIRYAEAARTFGMKAAQLVWEAGSAAIAQIQHHIQTEGIECEFTCVPGYLVSELTRACKKPNKRCLVREQGLVQKVEPSASVYLPWVPVCEQPAIKFLNQYKFHPRRYVLGLAAAIPDARCQIFENSEVHSIDKKTRSIFTRGGSISYKHLILATHVPHQGISSTLRTLLFQTKLAKYTTYVVGARIPKHIADPALFWDLQDPYAYLRIDSHEDHQALIFGGSDRKTGQYKSSDNPYEELEGRLQSLFPSAVLERRWCGQVVEPVDGLPYIGESSDGQFIATGYAGNGMTFGTLAGMMARDACIQAKNPWQDLFSIHRKTLRAAFDYFAENKDYPLHFVCDRFSKPKLKTMETVHRGEGAVIREDGKYVAVYKHHDGSLVRCSAVCPHLGCLVNWNAVDKVWDCPCHGSRFAPDGTLLSRTRQLRASRGVSMLERRSWKMAWAVRTETEERCLVFVARKST